MRDFFSNSQLVFSLIFFLAFPSLPATSYAQDDQAAYQDQKSPKATDNIVEQCPAGHVYKVFKTPAGLDVAYQHDANSYGIYLIDFRMLAFKEIQSELELTGKQIEKLRPVLENIHEYDTIWKFEVGCECIPAKEAATASADKLQAKLNSGGDLRDLLTDDQLKRLRQLENRFFQFDGERKYYGVRAKTLLSQLFLSDKQKSSIVEIVRDEVKQIADGNAKWEADQLRDWLEKCFKNDHFELLDQVAGAGGGWFATNPLIRSAQMSPFFSYPEIEDFGNKTEALANVDVQFQFIEPFVLANGRFVDRYDYFFRNHPTHGFSKWRRLGLLVTQGNSDWFSLVEPQEKVLDSLVRMEEYSGQSIIRFAGDEKLMEYCSNRPAVFNNLATYREFQKTTARLTEEVDLHIERTVKDSLLPHQLAALQFSIGASQFDQLGVFVVLNDGFLGDEFKLTDKQRVDFRAMITARREAELERLNSIEEKVLEQLSNDQRKQFTELFGDTTELFPSFVSHFTSEKSFGR